MMHFILQSLSDYSQVIFPMNPNEITVSEGGMIRTLNIIDIGSVTYPRGRNPRQYSFQGIFPGYDRSRFDFIDQWVEPDYLVATISKWIEGNVTLSFMVTTTSMYDRVFVENFQHMVSGGFGDREYNITLTEKRDLYVLQQSEYNGGSPSYKSQPPLHYSTYTTVVGDTLPIISKKAYGTEDRWSDIWTANKDIIGPDYTVVHPGMVLIIPGSSSLP